MHISLWNIALQTINFLVLVFLLQRFLYKPILAVIAERRQKVAHEQEAAALERQQAEQLKQDYLDKLAQLENEKAGVLQLAQKQAEVETAELRRGIEAQLADLQVRQTARLKSEREQVERELREQAVKLGLGIAERLLRDGAVVVEPLLALQLALRKVAALPEPERERCLGELRRHGGELTTITELSAPQREQLDRELAAACGVEVKLVTHVDPKLLQGVELRLGHLSFSLHLQAGLERVKLEILPR
jgi:F-type H+-transporting ATPase subunit b